MDGQMDGQIDGVTDDRDRCTYSRTYRQRDGVNHKGVLVFKITGSSMY